MLVAGADQSISNTRSANNARLSEYVLWKNRYDQESPCFQRRVHPEYIDKAIDIDKEREQDFKGKQCDHRIKDQVFDQRESTNQEYSQKFKASLHVIETRVVTGSHYLRNQSRRRSRRSSEETR